MSVAPCNTPPLAEFVDLKTIKERMPFNAEWFVRRHRPELVRAGAVIRPGGRLLFHPARMEAVAVEVGIANAARDLAAADCRP